MGLGTKGCDGGLDAFLSCDVHDQDTGVFPTDLLLEIIQGAFFAPEGLFHLQPWWSNFFENLLTVQYQHRMFAYALVILTGWHWWRVRASGAREAMLSANCLLAAVSGQVVLGIATLVMVVPIPMGAAHQAGAVIVLATAVWHAHRLTPSARLGLSVR